MVYAPFPSYLLNLYSGRMGKEPGEGGGREEAGLLAPADSEMEKNRPSRLVDISYP